MLNQIIESDWRILRELKPIALERFCERALSEVIRRIGHSKGAAPAYLAIFKLIGRRDDELAHAFDDLRGRRRSKNWRA